jgi:hypothetical protein
VIPRTWARPGGRSAAATLSWPVSPVPERSLVPAVEPGGERGEHRQQGRGDERHQGDLPGGRWPVISPCPASARWLTGLAWTKADRDELLAFACALLLRLQERTVDGSSLGTDALYGIPLMRPKGGTRER